MRLIVNTSNLYVGGGLQVALSFINELKTIERDNVYHIFLSRAVNSQIDKDDFPDNFHFYLISHSPSSLRSRIKIVRELDALVSEINPDVIFSVFGPTFWRPKAKHVMGFALGWLINPGSSAFDVLPLMSRIRKHIESKYKAYYVKRDADYYVTEIEDTKYRLSRIHGIDIDSIYIVGNTYNSFFDKKEYKSIDLPVKGDNEFRMITISHNYPHKNLKIIRDVIPYLNVRDLNYKFVLTIDEESFETSFGDIKDNVINLGPIDSELCPSAYEQCDALFLPTLLECFTASYPESMKMHKPILTSNLSFAKDICGNAAYYFDPLDPADVANKIIELSDNQCLRDELISNGVESLRRYETAASRAKKYVEICESLSN